MNQTTKVVSESPWGKHETFHEYIVARGDELSQSLAMLMTESFRPDAAKSLRLYSASEAADFIGTSVPNLRKVLSEAEIKGFDGQPVDVFQDARGTAGTPPSRSMRCACTSRLKRGLQTGFCPVEGPGMTISRFSPS